MTQEELQWAEACQGIRLRLTPEIPRWTDQIYEELDAIHNTHKQEHLAEMTVAEQKHRWQEGIHHTLQQKIVPQVLQQAMILVQKSLLFSQEERLRIRSQVSVWLDRWQPDIHVCRAESSSIPSWFRVGVVVLLFGGVGYTLGLMLPGRGTWIPALILMFCVMAVVGLTFWQNQAMQDRPSNRWKTSFCWLSGTEQPKEPWKSAVKQAAQSAISEAIHDMTVLLETIGTSEMLRREKQQQASDSWVQWFERCRDGLSEIYYSEQKRDPERALDACIKFMGDLQGMGVSIETIEKGQPFQADMEVLYERSGRVEAGDPVMTIHPVWKQQGQVLKKGMIKRYGR